jgi:hypothetical protein
MSTWDTLPRASKGAGYIAAIAGAVITVGTAWTMLNLPVPATRGYVDARLLEDSRAHLDIVGTVIELAHDQRERLKRIRDGNIVHLGIATDAEIKGDLQQLVEQQSKDVDDIEKRIASLERLRGSN